MIKTSARTVRDVARALLSGWGDFFWMVAGSMCFALLAVSIIAGTPGFADMAAQAQGRAVFVASVAAAAAFLAIFVAIWPRSAFYRDPGVHSAGLALCIGGLLLAVKWWLNRVWQPDTAFADYAHSAGIVLLVCAVVPLVEEAFFRGLAWQELRRRGISEPGILGATTLLFSLSHLPDGIAGLSQILFMGACLGLIRVFSGGIWAGVLCHGAMNGIVLFSL